MTDADLGNYIAALRQQFDVSQLSLCRKIGKSRGWLMRREKGRTRTSADDLYVIAKALNTPLDNFAYGRS